MNYGNVLVIGNSGVGKSTLINAALGDEAKEYAITGKGIAGTTEKLRIYESTKIPFRLIDTVGFEPSFLKKHKAIEAVKKWSKDSAEDENNDKQINVIWFCVDGTAGKLFPETIKSLSRATAMWKNVPIITVITKSYSEIERPENMQLVYNAFATQKRYSKNLKAVIPVVASTYTLNETAYAGPEGIAELIDKTNDLMPEGKQAAKEAISLYKLNRKRLLAHGMVGAATAGGAAIGAIPIPIADTALLSPLEESVINAVSRIYEIKDTEESRNFINLIVEVGVAGLAAKGALSALKAIPGVNIAAEVLNAVVAGGFVAAIGEASIYMFEKIYLGEKTLSDLDWASKIIESRLSNDFIEKITDAAKELAAGSSNIKPKQIAEVLIRLFAKN